MMKTRMAVHADINNIVKLRMMQVNKDGALDNRDKYALKLATVAYLNANIGNVAVTDQNGQIISAAIAERSAHLPDMYDMETKKTEVVFAYTMPEYLGYDCTRKELKLLGCEDAAGVVFKVA